MRHRQIEIRRHLLDNATLLGVLLAEKSRVGLCDVEKLEHHRRHAAEMARPRRAAQAVLELRDLDEAAKIRRINCRRVRHKDQMDTLSGAKLNVFIQWPRVAGKILVGAELHRIDENRHDDKIARLPGCLDQTDVAGVQRAHGRYQPDRLPAAPRLQHRLTNSVNVADYTGRHGEPRFSRSNSK